MCGKCGNLRSVCHDEHRTWYPQRDICWATASREVASRRWQEKLGDKPNPDAAGYLPTDGTTVWVSDQDLTPDDHFI